MTTFRLTFNKPAVRQFVGYDEKIKNIRIKIEGEQVMFMPTKRITDDSVPLEPRSRGGREAIIEGELSGEVLKRLHNPQGPFFILERHSKDWIVAKPYNEIGVPSRFDPHVRLWDNQHKSVAKPTSYKAKPVAIAKEAPMVDPVDKIQWALDIVKDPQRVGRPSKERKEAEQIVSDFERAAIGFVTANEDTMLRVYRVLHEHFKNRETEGRSRSDDQSETEIQVALRKLGLDEKPIPMMGKIRAPLDVRAMNGGERAAF